MCFDLLWLRDIIIWIILVCGVVALLSLLLRFVVPKMKDVFGISDQVIAFIIAALRIVIWVIILCAIVYFIFALITCLAPSMPRVR